MEFLDTHHWVPIHTLPGFEGCIEYYISREGKVLSTKGEKERILKLAITADGYQLVHLRKRLGKRGEITCTVHKLVAYAFLPPPPTPHGRGKGSSLINHIDHNRSNNNVSNLEWISSSDNCKNKINFSATEFGRSDWYQLKKMKNREFMAEKRLDPEFRAKEQENAKEYYYKIKADPEAWKELMEKKKEYKKDNPEKEKEWMDKCLKKRAEDPERVAALKEYKKKHREAVKNDPEKLAKQREYQREYMRRKRAAEKQVKIEEHND